MTEQTSLFTKDNLAIAFSIVSLIIAMLTYFLKRRKLNLEKEKLRREFYMGFEKLRELIHIITPIQNIDPNDLTIEKFEGDKYLFNNLFSKYDEHEDKIIKCSYLIPKNITSIKRILTNIEDNFNNRVNNKTYTPEKEKLKNYSDLYFQLSLLSSPIYEITDKGTIHVLDKEASKHFMELYIIFKDQELFVDRQIWNGIMEEFESLKKDINNLTRH